MKKEPTPTQLEALKVLRLGVWQSAYELQVSIATLNALERKGFVENMRTSGAMFSPRTNILWRKTETDA